MDLKELLGELYREDMTVSDMAEALRDKELVDKSILSGYVTKDTADKYATEAANYKKQLRDKLTADEVAAAKTAEEQEAIRQELETLRTKNTISDYKSRLLEMSYSPELAASTAEALARGDMDTVFKGQAAHIELREKAIKAEALARMQPPPSSAGGDSSGANQEGMKIATQLGRDAAQSNAVSSETMKHYV